MKKDNYSINEIVKWYEENTDTPIPQDFIIYMVKNHIIFPRVNATYSLDEINDLLLEKEYGSYVVIKDKLKVKDNRKPLIKKCFTEQTCEAKKYKIANLSGNKLKLIKLG